MSAEDDMAWPAGTTVIPADPPSPLTAEEFWKGKCLDCAHPEHEMTCHEMIPNGDPSNGPAYCPCAAMIDLMEQEIVRLRAALASSPAPAGHTLEGGGPLTDHEIGSLRDRIDNEQGSLHTPPSSSVYWMRRLLATLDAARGGVMTGNPEQHTPAPAGLDVEALAERVRVLENTIIEFFIYYDMDDYAALGIPEKALADVIGNDQVPSGSKP